MPDTTPQLDAWLHSVLGAALLTAETDLLAEALDDVFGWELLQVGLWGPARGLLRACRTRQQTVIADRACEGVDLVARLPQLPISSGTADAVLLPHALEFLTDPKAMIREADRVLAGEGQLIVMGFRPFSLWGLRARAANGAFPPGLKGLLGEGRVRDWLALLGYEIISSRHYLRAAPWSARMPAPASAYLLKARKRVYTMTPIKIRPRERSTVLGGLVEPTRRTRS